MYAVDGLILLIIGLAGSLLFLIYVAKSQNHSVHGLKGIILFVFFTLFSIALALAVNNFTWDVMSIHNIYANVSIGSAISYLPALLLSKHIFQKENKYIVNKALIVTGVLFIILIIVWFIAETMI